MKKLIIGAIVGGIIIFIWQTASWMILNLHGNAYRYTDKQNEILATLSSQLSEEGQYYMPNVKPDATMEEHEALMESSKGKPWAMVSYHKAFEMSMTSNIIRGLLVDILLVGLFCWILSKMNAPTFGTIFTASVRVGLIVFTNGIYTGHIWYQTFDLMAHFTDYLVSWGLCGIWLGFWYKKK
jgi:hypothetical protein